MQQLNIHFRKTYGIPKILVVSFGIRIQHAGSDYTVYANHGYTPQDYEHPVLKSIIEQLFTDTSGVPHVTVEPFALEIRYVDAVTSDDIEQLVCAGLLNAGYEWVIKRDEYDNLAVVRDCVREMLDHRRFTRGDRQRLHTIAQALGIHIPAAQ